MAKQITLEAQVRDSKQKAKNLRKQSVLPAVCYGQGEGPVALQMDYQQFRRAFKEASTTSVISLKVDEKEVPVLVYDYEINPVTDEYSHVDFIRVNLKEEVDATVPVKVVGVSPAVKNHGGILSVVKHEIEVRSLPNNIPHEISIDVSKMENIGDAVLVKDLKLGDKVEILEDLEETVLAVQAPKEYQEESVEVPDEMKAEGEAGAGSEGADAKKEGEEEKKE